MCEQEIFVFVLNCTIFLEKNGIAIHYHLY